MQNTPRLKQSQHAINNLTFRHRQNIKSWKKLPPLRRKAKWSTVPCHLAFVFGADGESGVLINIELRFFRSIPSKWDNPKQHSVPLFCSI